MNTIHYNDTVQLSPCVATIGFFDGVHRGHQFLIHHLVETARKDGLQSTVITFDAHPRKVLQADYQPEMLSTLDSKLLLLSKTEVDNAVVLHFDKTMAAMSAREFMQQVLHDHLNVRKLFIGNINHITDNCLTLFIAKCACDKVILHIHHCQNSHKLCSFHISCGSYLYNSDGVVPLVDFE